jgi:hypothetical protein
MGFGSSSGSGIAGLTATGAQLNAAAANLDVEAVTAAGTDLAGATLLTKGISKVTVNTDGHGVRLSTLAKQTIINLSATKTLKVWPNAAGKAINFGTNGAALTLAPHGRVSVETI